MVQAFVICPNEYIGDMMALISEKRGTVDHTETLDPRRVMLTSRVPLNEILIDFHDRIKSLTRGYGSMDYEHAGYAISDMVKLDMLVNGDPVDAFSCIVHRDKAEFRGRASESASFRFHRRRKCPGTITTTSMIRSTSSKETSVCFCEIPTKIFNSGRARAIASRPDARIS